MIVAWLIAIGVLVLGVLLVAHMGVNVIGALASGVHTVEHFLARPL